MINEDALKKALMIRMFGGLVFDIVMLLVAIYSGWWFGERYGREEALKTAYNTKNVSEGLETACTVLWVGEQNKKYWKKEQESGR